MQFKYENKQMLFSCKTVVYYNAYPQAFVGLQTLNIEL